MLIRGKKKNNLLELGLFWAKFQPVKIWNEEKDTQHITVLEILIVTTGYTVWIVRNDAQVREIHHM